MHIKYRATLVCLVKVVNIPNGVVYKNNNFNIIVLKKDEKYHIVSFILEEKSVSGAVTHSEIDVFYVIYFMIVTHC